MPAAPRLPSRWISDHPWIWGLSFGLLVGGGVLVLSSLRFGLRFSNLTLGFVVFVAFGLLGFVGGLFRRYTPGGPA
ncbi:MAG TPA: hypothetical protein VKT80_19735 [Chloroflexota bacterium]|nr:hypothetical protein [Chloroflexota bacterium]